MKEVVSTTLKDVLGETPAQALMFHLGDSSSLSQPEAFSRNLERLVGGGAAVVERLIAKSLFERAGIRADQNGPFDFGASVAKAKRLLAQKERGS